MAREDRPSSAGDGATSPARSLFGTTPLLAAGILFAANTAALAIKGWDEHRTGQAHAHNLLARDAALSARDLDGVLRGHVAALAGASDPALVQAAGFGPALTLDASGRVRGAVAAAWHEALREPARSGAAGAALGEGGFAVIAPRPGGGFVAARVALDDMLARQSDPSWGRVFALPEGTALGATLRLPGPGGEEGVSCARSAVLNTPVCVGRPVPGFGIEEASRWLIYLLLAAAPVLGGLGLWRMVQRRDAELSAEIQLRKAEIQLRKEAQQQLAISVDGAGVGVWRFDIASGEIVLNDRLAHMMDLGGLRRMKFEEFADRFQGDDRKAVLNARHELQRTGQFTLTARVGSLEHPLFLDLRGRAAQVPGGFSNLAGGVAFDVTRQRVAEARLLTAERRLRDAIEVVSGPFALWDSRRRLLYCNRAFGVTFGIEPSRLQRGATYESIAVQMSRQIRAEKPSEADSKVREIHLVDGRWLQMAERVTLDGGMISLGLDISAVKRNEEAAERAEKKLRRSLEELSRAKDRAEEMQRLQIELREKAEAASKAKSVFLANTGHELRTPLGAINGFSEMLVKQVYGPLGNPKYVDYAKDVLTAGRHLLDVINDILDMSKIEAGKLQISRAPMDVEDAIDEAVRILRQKVQEKGLAFHIDVPRLPEIEGDHRSVRQMMLNLIGNAIKFTDAGSITVKAREDGEFIRVDVTDTGVGIPESALGRLGRPFEQVEQAYQRKHGGTGLGLALTRSFAEMMGGRMEIASKEGEGTTVSFWLALKAAVQMAAE